MWWWIAVCSEPENPIWFTTVDIGAEQRVINRQVRFPHHTCTTAPKRTLLFMAAVSLSIFKILGRIYDARKNNIYLKVFEM